MTPGTRVYDRFRGWTAEVVRPLRGGGYVLRRAGNPPPGQHSPIAVGETYRCEARWVQLPRRNPLRRNGDVIDFASRRPAPPAPAQKESTQEKLARLAKYIDQHADAGITASQLAHDFLVPEETAEGVLEAVVAKGLLRPLSVQGQTVYRRVVQKGPFVQVRPDAEIAADRERSRRVGKEARARASSARYPVGTVLTLKGGRRRYAVARVEPRYGDVQTYLLVALSGGEAGSVPSGVREDELKRHPDQTLSWEGVEARRLQQKFVTYSGIGETGDAARAAYARAGEMVRSSGPIHVDAGVRLLQQLRPLRRHARVSLAPGGRKKGVAYVTVSGWKKDSELRDRLGDAVSRLVQAGLGEHINAIEAYLGRIIVTAEPAPPRNAERVWAELARVSENADLRGNPRAARRGRR